MKKLKWIVVLIIGIALIFLCVKRWNTWFGNPVEPAYTSLSEPGRIQLTFGNNGEFSRNISWQCGDSLEPSKLFIVEDETTDTLFFPAEGKVFHTTGGVTVSYHVKLENLKQGSYHYSVFTGEKQSGWYRFDVNNNNDNRFSFVYLGDIQDTINGITKKVLSSIKHEHLADCWILGGDVVERPHDQYWNEYFQSTDSISQTIPIIACPGNHEYLKGAVRKLEERFIYTFSYFIDSRYKKHAVFDINCGNTAIITLDSNKDPWTLFSQKRWFKNALERSKNAQWKVVVLHHPIHSIRGKINNLIVKWMFNPLIKEYGVDIVLQGHEHAYARMISKEKNGCLTTPVYLISQFSPKDYRIYFNEKYDRFGNGLRFYQVIDVNRDTLNVKTFTETNELYDNVCLIKDKDKVQVVDLSEGIPEHFEINARTKKMKSDERANYQKDIENWARIKRE